MAAFVAHGAWTTRKNTPKQAVAEAVEPSLGGDAHDTVPMALNADTPAFNLPVAPKRPMLDALIDVIAAINLDGTVHAVSGEAAWKVAPRSRKRCCNAASAARGERCASSA